MGGCLFPGIFVESGVGIGGVEVVPLAFPLELGFLLRAALVAEEHFEKVHDGVD